MLQSQETPQEAYRVPGHSRGTHAPFKRVRLEVAEVTQLLKSGSTGVIKTSAKIPNTCVKPASPGTNPALEVM